MRWMGAVGAVSLFFCVGLAGCSSSTSEREAVDEANQALSATAQRILSFEDPLTDWQISCGSKARTDVHADGAHALALTAGGYCELRSPTLSGLGQVDSKLSLDVQVPTPDPNPWWHGSVQLVVDLPSQGVHSQSLGDVALGAVVGKFQRVEFAVPEALRKKLAASYSDLRFRIVVNVPQAAKSWVVDRLSVGGQVAKAPLGPTKCEAGGRCLLLVQIPRALAPASAALVANQQLKLADRARVETADSAPGTAVNAGPKLTELGVEAKTGDVWSVGPVELRNRASAGVVRAPKLTLGNGATVQSSDALAEVKPLATYSWLVSPPAAQHACVDLQPNQTRSLDPGSYAATAVKPRAKLTLKTGVYFFQALTVEPQAEVLLDQANGPVYIYVLGDFSYRGSFRALGGAATPNLLLGALGTHRVLLEAPFSGTLVAPNAELSFAPNLLYQGAFYARDVSAEPGATIRSGSSLLLAASGGSGDRQSCINALGDEHVSGLDGAQQLSRDQLAFCLAPGIPDCAATMISSVNMDRSAAALRYMSKTFDSSDYLAVSRDRGRKRHALLADSGLLKAYCSGDADADLVPDGVDACPGTPPLTPTDDRGCTDATRPDAIGRGVVDALLGRMGFLQNQKCDGYGTPPAPRISSFNSKFADNEATGSVWLRVWQIHGLPKDCDLWYEINIYDPDAPAGFPQHYSLTYHGDEFVQSVAPDERPMTTFARARDLGDRSVFARSVVTKPRREVFVTTRATTGSGQQSVWSAPTPVQIAP